MRRIVRQNEAIPDYYGVAYRDLARPDDQQWHDWVRICYPIPLNLVVRVWHGFWHLVWRVVKVPHHFPLAFDMNIARRYRGHAVEIERLSRQVEDLELEIKQAQMTCWRYRQQLDSDVDRSRDCQILDCPRRRSK